MIAGALSRSATVSNSGTMSIRPSSPASLASSSTSSTLLMLEVMLMM